MTRATVCRLLGVTRCTVTYYLKTGRLHSTVGPDGVHQFDRSEVEALAQTRRSRRLQTVGGDVAADVFALFEAGHSPAEVVIELAQPTEIIRALWEDYKAFESQRPSRGQQKAGRPRELKERVSPLPPGRFALALLPSSAAEPAPNVSPWSRQFDLDLEKRRIRRAGNRP